MSANFTNLPVNLQALIQQGFLDRMFEKGIEARLGYDQVAEVVPFNGENGNTVTKTKRGLLPTAPTPRGPTNNADLTDGLSSVQAPFEQYTIGVENYEQTMDLNLANAGFAIDSLFLNNAYILGEAANRTVDELARNALFDGYSGGNTRVRTTLGSAGASVAVDDVRGFFESILNTKVVPTSLNPMNVYINGNVYSCTNVVADGPVPAQVDYTFVNLNYSGSNTNVSTVPGGKSGVLTFSTNVSTGDATAGNTVVAATAPTIIRPEDPNTSIQRSNISKIVAGDLLNLRQVQQATTTMRSNGVFTPIWCIISEAQRASLYRDQEFRQALQGQWTLPEYQQGVVERAFGINFMTTNMALVDTQSSPGVTIHRAIVVAEGALLKAEYTDQAYANRLQDEVSEVSIVNNIAHITRPPLNLSATTINQTWSTYVGYVTPTDTTANPTTIPTANNASRKKAIILESAV